MREVIAIFSKLTAARIVNMFLVIASYYVARFLGNPVQWGKPISLAFEPTTSCNLRCPECPSGLRSFTRPTGSLDPGLFHQTIDQVKDYLMYLTFYFQGEPYLNPEFLPMVEYASNRGIFTSTSTNGHYLDDDRAQKTVESGLKKLIISVDGTDQDTYSKYRIGGNLAKVLEGTRNLVRWKKRLRRKYPIIILQFLVMRSNQDQIEQMRILGGELGVERVVFKTTQIYDYQNGSDLIPTIDRYSRYRENGSGKYKVKNKMRNQCWKMWHSNVVTWDGKVVPCCFDKDAQHLLGNLKEESFSQVWQGKDYRQFRKRVFNSRKEIDICGNCSEGTNIWL